MKNAGKILVGKPKVERPVGRLSIDNIKMVLQEIFVRR
jgi:hypothetical protein